ncbi:MAG: iron ABC transporter permease [Flammeovirgaceae bacterium]
MNEVITRSKKKYVAYLAIICIILFVFNLLWGSVAISPLHFFESFGGKDASTFQSILLKIRLPKAIVAQLAGSALAVSGLLMQTLFRNPLAGPGALGITAGASLGVAFVILFLGNHSFSSISGVGGFWGGMVVLFSFLGALCIMLLIVLIASQTQDNPTLLIAGMMLGNAIFALISIAEYFSHPENLQTYLLWTFGSLGGVTLSSALLLAIITPIGIFMAFIYSKKLNILLLGEEYSQNLGIDLKRSKINIILMSSLLAGGVTAFCGPIAFVGLTAPHLARNLLNTANHRYLIPASALMGAAMMAFCNLITQFPNSAYTLPINAATTLLGAPIILWILLTKKKFTQ